VGILNLVDPLGGVAVKHESSLPGSARRKRGIGFIGDGYEGSRNKENLCQNNKDPSAPPAVSPARCWEK